MEKSKEEILIEKYALRIFGEAVPYPDIAMILKEFLFEYHSQFQQEEQIVYVLVDEEKELKVGKRIPKEFIYAPEIGWLKPVKLSSLIK